MQTAAKTTTTTLPIFNPDAPGADALAWYRTTDMILSEHPLEGSALVMALTKALVGSSSPWLAQICHTGITWPEFGELFIQRYEGIETPAAFLTNMLNGRPNANECISVYASRLVTSLLTNWNSMKLEEIAVAVVLTHASKFDAKLQKLIFTTNVKMRNEMQQQLKAYAFKRSDHLPSGSEPERKRQKMQTPSKCFYCGKTGHKVAECRKKKADEKPDTRPHRPHSTSGRERAGVTCYKCSDIGHIASACLKREVSSGSIEKRVNLCTVIKPKGKMYQLGELFPFFL